MMSQEIKKKAKKWLHLKMDSNKENIHTNCELCLKYVKCSRKFV